MDARVVRRDGQGGILDSEHDRSDQLGGLNIIDVVGERGGPEIESGRETESWIGIVISDAFLTRQRLRFSCSSSCGRALERDLS